MTVDMSEQVLLGQASPQYSQHCERRAARVDEAGSLFAADTIIKKREFSMKMGSKYHQYV